ncbi:MAG: FecR family protein [Haliscomenobacter sp.]
MLQEAEYLDLITRFLSGHTTDEEARVLQDWKDSSPAHARLFESYAQTWALFDGYQPTTPATDVSHAWATLEQRITAAEPATPPLRPSIRRLAPRIVRFSAVAAILLLLTALGMHFWLRDHRVSQPWHEAVCQTGTRTITLPDGSTVWLNTGSRLSWNPAFRTHRQVTLEGEAFFEVTPDKAHPFTIESGSLRTTVLGTSFNIRAFPGEKTVEVSVVTGTVRLTASGQPNHTLRLPAGHQARLLADSQILEPLPHANPNTVAWKEARLTFDGTPLPELLSDLERYFHIDIQVQDGLERCTFYGDFEQPDLQQILQVLQLAMGLEIENDHGVYLVSGTPCP